MSPRVCHCCRPSVVRCFFILVVIWVTTMFISVHYSHRWRPDFRPNLLIHHQATSIVSQQQQQQQGKNINDAQTSSSPPVSSVPQAEKLNCFAVVVSNEEYIDGTLILGYSLRKHSKLAQTGKAELVVVVPENALSKDSIERLHLAGWNHVLEVEDLAKKAPKAHWAGTFNKLHLFRLTQYALVAFFDADMIMQHNPDYIFRTHLRDYRHIGALGNSLVDRSGKPRAAYFQTGMMLLVPSDVAYNAMMDDFYHGKDSRGLNGRDGLIIRRYFGANYKNLDDALSAHVGTNFDYEWVTGLHYRGGFKPWFNRATAPAYDEAEVHRLKKKGATDFGPPGKWLEIGPVYSIWWETYEEFHRAVMMKRDEELMMPPKQNSDFPAGYNPRIHVWMNRHSKKKSYIQLLRSEERAEREKKVAAELKKLSGSIGAAPVVDVVVGEAGANCDDACKTHGEKKANNFMCRDELLASPSQLQSCRVISKHLANECRNRCLGSNYNTNKNENSSNKNTFNSESEIYNTLRNDDVFFVPGGRSPATSSQPDSSSCSFNNFLNPYVVPRCNATPPSALSKRICLCVSRQHAKNNYFDVTSGSNRNNNKIENREGKAQQAAETNHNSQQESVHDEEKEHELRRDDYDDDDGDGDKAESASSCVVAHPAQVQKSCMLRLQDTKRHPGSWQLLSASLLAERQRHSGPHQRRLPSRRATKRHPGKASHDRLLPILSRHHDGFAAVLWFPQKSVASSCPLQTILLSHLVGRIVGLEWVPATALVHFPLQTTPKHLIQKLGLRRHHQKKNEHLGESGGQVEGDEGEDEVDVEGKRVLEDIVGYLVPGECSDVVAIERKNSNKARNNNNNHGAEDDYSSSSTSSSSSYWSVRTVVSSRTSNNHNQQFQHYNKKNNRKSDNKFNEKDDRDNNNIDVDGDSDDDDDDNNMGSIIDWNNASQYSEASLFKFLLGVPGKFADNTRALTWELLMEHVDQMSASSLHELTREVPRCAILEAIEAQKRREIFTGGADKRSRLSILADALQVLVDKKSEGSDAASATGVRQRKFCQLLQTADVDAVQWRFVGNSRGNDDDEVEELFTILSKAAQVEKANKFTFLEHVQKRVEILISLVSRCVLL